VLKRLQAIPQLSSGASVSGSCAGAATRGRSISITVQLGACFGNEVPSRLSDARERLVVESDPGLDGGLCYWAQHLPDGGEDRWRSNRSAHDK
jgi:hypothetical protein